MTKRIRDGKLFKNVSPFIRSITPEKLESELLQVKRSHNLCGFDVDGMDLIRSFTWRNTPQGCRFWSALHAEFEENTEICYVPD